MPHCTIEFAEHLEKHVVVNHMLKAVFSAMTNSDLFTQDNDIKTRAIAYKHYLVGETKADFIHVTIKLLSGRTKKQKQHLSELVLKQLLALDLCDVTITIDIVEMDKSSYVKVLL